MATTDNRNANQVQQFHKRAYTALKLTEFGSLRQITMTTGTTGKADGGTKGGHKHTK
jgi:hypothetical protein